MVTEEVNDTEKLKLETIKLLKENISKSRVSVRKMQELRSFLFYAVHRGIPLSIKNISSDFLSGQHENYNVKPLSQYVLELEQTQRRLESLLHYITYCEEEIEEIMNTKSCVEESLSL
jgi:hypothetical protein